MEISGKLPQFFDKKALFLVLSKYRCKIYIAKNKKINIIKEFEVKKPRFFDKAGIFFKKKGKGGSVGSSAVRENIGELLEKELIKEFKLALKNILKDKSDFDYVYLFASQCVIREVGNIIKKDFFMNIKLEIEGNYIKTHPFKLLEKISI